MPASGRYTVDASCLGKLVADEEDAIAYRQLHQHLLAQPAVTIEAPPLIEFELGNLLHKKLQRVPPDAAEMHRLAVQGVELTNVDWKMTYGFGAGLTFYDAAYITHARLRETVLLTFDATMAKRARGIAKVWDAYMIRYVTDPSFLDWVKGQKPEGLKPLQEQIRDDPQMRGAQTYLQLDVAFQALDIPAAWLPILESAYERFVDSKRPTKS